MSAVEADSPAEGVLRVGDVVVGLAGAPADSLNHLVHAIRRAPADDVNLVLQRATVQQQAAAAFQALEPHAEISPVPVEEPLVPPPVDDIFEHQDQAVAHLTAAYARQRRGDTLAEKRGAEYALTELLSVAGGIARSRASTSARSVQLISDLLYRLKRANVPLDAKFCNIVMWSYIAAGAPKRAKELFNEILRPNVECYTTLIKAHSMMRKPDEAIALISEMRKNGVKPNIRTYNALITSCVRGGKLAKARQLFSEMLVDEIRPNAVSWNIIINWHVQQKTGPRRLRSALQAFSDMKASGVVPNVITFTTIMKAYAKSGLLNKAEEVFAEMKQRLPSKLDTNAYNTLLRAYAWKLDWRRCLELLDEMEGFYVPDGLSVTRRLGRGNTVDGVRDVPSHSRSFSKRRPWLSEDRPNSGSMHEKERKPLDKRLIEFEDAKKCKPDAISYSLAVKACASAGRLDIARDIFDEMMERGFYPPPGPAVVSLMAGYAKVGMLTESFSILKNLKSWGVFPEERMLSSLMHGCLMANQPSLALSVYAKFKSAKFFADVVTHTLLLKAYGMTGELDKAFNVLKGMQRAGPAAKPNIVTYNVLIEMSLRQGRRDLALKALGLLLRDKEAVRCTNRNTFAALVLPVMDGAGIDDATRVSGGMNESGLYSVGSERGMDIDPERADKEDEANLQYLMDVLRRVREGGINPTGKLYRALLTTCEGCGEWHLGSSLVKEREMGGFVVGKQDRNVVRVLEDTFRARSVSERSNVDGRGYRSQ